MAKRVRKLQLEDGREIRYIVTRKMSNRVKVRINAKGIVDVLADQSVRIKTIEGILIERADHILEVLEHYLERNRTFCITSDNVQWLGISRPVEIIRSPEETVRLFRFGFRVFTMHPNHATDMLNVWTRQNFADLAGAISAEVGEDLERAGLKPPATKITVKDMKTRWGSCSYTRGRISINYALMVYPIDVLRAVMWHEYAHYWHPNHSEEFYAFVERYYPSYRYWHSMLK